MIFSRAALAFALTLVALPAAAQSQPKAVVELFTSQGCASCPPADSLLQELAKDPQIIALTMPVDYWDYIGWKDTLALHGHSVRQKAYAERRADHKVFTPQAVVDGVHAVKGSDRAALQRAIMGDPSGGRSLTVPLTVRQNGNLLEIEIPDSSLPPEGAELWACPVASTKSVTIGRGENTGRSMTYANVVRGWVKIGPWTGSSQRHRVKLSDLSLDEADSVAILLQAGTATAPGPILGAALLSLE
ncbi:DUF1223 domain-containing protein [Xanthobacter sp. V4C-4]|uniref:DUF1223 domain-containing protein n=1 Tax=Xanthobacter cornucopiae TaxID=3119924 RepID=UPI003726AD18